MHEPNTSTKSKRNQLDFEEDMEPSAHALNPVFEPGEKASLVLVFSGYKFWTEH